MGNLFCLKHIVGLIWVSVMIVGLYFASHKVKDKFGVNLVLKIGAVLLVFMELLKYGVLLVHHSMSWDYFPLQFCSLMLYIYPIVAFFPERRIARIMLPFAFSGGLLAGLIALIIPTNILGNPQTMWLNPDDVLPIISFIYHGLMIWFSSYLVYSQYYRPRYRDTVNVLAFLFFFALIATGVNTLFQQDFMMLREGIGNPLSFLMAYHYLFYILAQVVLFLILNPLFITIVKILQKRRIRENRSDEYV